MINKIIHYCWFGGGKLPEEVVKCIESWKKACPDYKIICWNESNFDVHCHQFVGAAYDAKQWAFVSDYARLKIVYENGGIYLDTDVELLRRLDDLLVHKAFFGIEQLHGNVATGLIFGAEKGNVIIKKMMQCYDDVKFDINNKYKIACPRLNTSVFKEYGFINNGRIQVIEGAALYPPCYFDPIAPGTDDNLLCSETYSIHHYHASWTSKSNRLKRKIVRILGNKTVFWLKQQRTRIRKNKV